MTDPARPDIFVSYRHRTPHAAWVREVLVPALEADGYSVVLDVHDFAPGGLLIEDMEAASDARLTVAVADASYPTGGFVHFERLVATRLLGVLRDRVDGLVVPGAADVVDLVGNDDPRPVLTAVHRLVRRVFVLESEEDRDWVEGVVIPALDSSGVSTEHTGDIVGGEPWSDAVTQRLLRSDRVVIVLSRAYLRQLSPRADDLVGSVERAEDRILSLPVQLEDGIAIPKRYPPFNIIDATDPGRWDETLEKLCAAVGVDLAPLDRTPACPYPGMRAYTKAQEDVFAGRDDEIEEVLSGLRREQFVAIIGPSASGKSSLAVAGVGPRVARLGLDGARGWVVVTVRPGPSPISEIDAAVSRWRAGTAADASGAAPGATACLLLIIDQLEAIYAGTAAGAADVEARLLQLRGDPAIHIILTVRADFYPNLMNGLLWPCVNACRVELVPLRGDRLRDAIDAPARARGVVIAGALLERLVAETEGQPGLQPFLQETLVTLWSGMRYRYLSVESYDAAADRAGVSGITQAIRRVAETAVGEVEARHPDGERIVRSILLRLVQFGEGRPDTRRQVAVSDLRSAAPDDATFDSVFDVLVRRRLVTRDRDAATGALVADLSHEAIIQGWPAFATWIEHRRAAEGTRRRLLADAEAWDRRTDHPDAGLLRDVELDEARRWLSTPDAAEVGVDPVIRRFVDRSAAVAQRARRRRRRALVGTFAALVLVAGVLAASAIAAQRAQRRAERASTERLALQLSAAASELSDDQLPLRALLVRAGDALNPNPVSLVEMLATVERQRLITARIDAPEGVGFDALWADGEVVAAGDGDGTVRVWSMGPDGPDLGSMRRFDVGETVLAISRRPGSDILAVGVGDGSAEDAAFRGAAGAAYLVDLDAPGSTPVRLPLAGDSPVSALAFSGNWLLAGRWDGTVAVVDSDLSEHPVVRVLETDRVAAPAADTCMSSDRKVRSIAVDDASRWIAAGTNACVISVWDAQRLEGAPQALVGHTAKVRVIAFVPGSATLLSSGDDRSIRRWDLGAASVGIVMAGAADESRVIGLCVTPDGRSVVTAGRDHTVRRWEFDGTALDLDPRAFRGHGQTIRAVSCLADGAFASLGADGLVLWDLNRPSRSGHSVVAASETHAVAVRPGDAPDVAVAASGERGVLIVERPSGDRRELDLGTMFPFAAAYSPDGRLIGVAGDEPDASGALAGVAVVYDADSLAEVARVTTGPGATLRAVAIRDGAHHAVGGADGTIHTVAAGTTRDGRTDSGFGVRSLAYTPGGDLLVGDDYGTLACYAAADPTRRPGRMQLGRAVTGLAVGADGSVLAGTSDGFVAVIDVGRAEPCDASAWRRTNLTVNSDGVSSVALLGEGPLGAFGTTSGTLELWDVERRRRVGTLAAAPDSQAALAAGASDASTIVVAAGGSVDVYRLDRDELRGQLCALAGRELTASERQAFLPDGRAQERARCSGASP